MSAAFPAERAAKRAHLLATVEGLRDVVAAGAEEGERLRTLPPATVRALADSGLFALKVPESLGDPTRPAHRPDHSASRGGRASQKHVAPTAQKPTATRKAIR